MLLVFIENCEMQCDQIKCYRVIGFVVTNEFWFNLCVCVCVVRENTNKKMGIKLNTKAHGQSCACCDYFE